jgi:hypothetical protein
MWPSTERIATLGGFIAGGHSGIGSVRHGILADPGNVRRLRIVTLEDPPRVLDLLGSDIQKAHHAYGSNGVIVTEVEVALTPGSTGSTPSRCSTATTQCCASAWRPHAAARTDARPVPAQRGGAAHHALLRRPARPSAGRDAMFAQVSPSTLPAYAALVRRWAARWPCRAAKPSCRPPGCRRSPSAPTTTPRWKR